MRWQRRLGTFAETRQLLIKNVPALRAEGRFDKQDFAYLPDEDVYRCPSGQLLPYHYTHVEHGMTLRCYWYDGGLPRLRDQEPMYASKERRITRPAACLVDPP